MSRLSVLQSQLTKVESRISEIEAKYPGILAVKSYSASTSLGPSKTNQDFGPVAREYESLLNRQLDLATEIDTIQNAAGGSFVAGCRPVSP